MHWGRGQIVEEAAYHGRYHEPALQLLEFEDGSLCLRFCYYHHGRFQRGPLMLDAKELGSVRQALRKAPRLRKLLKTMISA